MRKIKYLIFSLICFSLMFNKVFASGIEINVTSSTITKGTSITVTAKFTSSESIFFTEGTLACTGAGVNKSVSLNNDDMTDGKLSKSFSLSITPSEVGKVTCSVNNAKLTTASSGSWTSVSTGAKTITVNAPVVNKTPTKTKSSNNYLSSLTIEGYELDKAFNKETLEYNVLIKPDDEEININAQTENNKATVTGLGKISLNPGLNKIEIKVKAENGNLKTYVINATLEEYKEIEVSIDNKKYYLVRKEGLIDPLSNYEKTTINIDNEDVLAYYNEKTKYYLVVLKDENDNYNYYIYENGKYTLYKEYDFSGIKLFIMDKKIDNDNVVSTTLNIGEDKVNAYVANLNKDNATYALDNDKVNDYYLVYAMNVNTGNKDYYLIDNKEKNILRYSDEIGLFFTNNIVSDNNNYKTYFFIALFVFGLTILITGITLIIKGKKNKHKYSIL